MEASARDLERAFLTATQSSDEATKACIRVLDVDGGLFHADGRVVYTALQYISLFVRSTAAFCRLTAKYVPLFRSAPFIIN